MTSSARADRRPAAPEGQPWRMTAAYRRALGLGVGGLAVGLALGSVDVALLALPLALTAVLAAGRRPVLVAAPTRVVPAGPATVDVALPVTIEVTGSPRAVGAELVVVRVPGPAPEDGLDPTGGVVAVRPRARRRDLVATTVPRTWGRRTVARPDALCVAHDGLLVVGPVLGPVQEQLVVPAVGTAVAGPLPPHPTSVLGRHVTRRTGDGSELYSVDAFRSGDRMRHIDWRATARRGHGAAGLVVHVRRTVVEAEGQVVLLLDTRADLQADVAGWSVPGPLDGGALGPGSSLDQTVTTAVALAAAHLQAGDRVASVDLTVRGRAVGPGAGRRQLQRLRTVLAETTATGTSFTPRGARGGAFRLPRRLLELVPARALVVVLSPFLDDEVAALAGELRRCGRSTVGVDCLPSGLRPDPGAAAGEAALGLVLAERQQRIAGLASAGVDVLPAGADLTAATRRLVRARQRSAR
ncbi:DUF58 domain-containing protein [Aquipuribacter sp. MA13-6]|uniref:DUF58 domain-containing protein n=1 Tax=unclassified Aquipuribacter TaxID=2635084 RepID=UPI003EEDE0BF